MTTAAPLTFTVRIIVSAVVLVMLCSSAYGCSCFQRTLKVQYYDPLVTRVVRAVVQSEWPAVVTNQAAKKYYFISVQQALRGAPNPASFGSSPPVTPHYV
jgi:hypothetical protein